jgi:peroxiredoxin
LVWAAVGLAILAPVVIPTARWVGLWRSTEPAVWVRPAADAALAPEFSVRTVDGRPFTLADYRGRPVILFFMAAWCSPCAYEARALARLYAEYGDRGLEVLAVDIDPSEGEADLKRFREWAVPQAGYRWALDPEGALVRAFKVRALDTTVVIDPEGRIVYRDEVSTPYGTLKEVVGRLWK